ncbi:putative pyridoxal-dependent aspartate 1-decarboxylase [Vibrio alginolyticus]|jgi:glutamate decarboxylase|uniref:Putative pyridoxal-dependent aspartate 1-decarboxylase n=1 Tax=Vibrio alginolyticus TaxID=663 RepID=A0A7Y4EWJ5_VIBAL|nr:MULTISPECIES: putative pyridoxal-dependent aspartate 1-decarboxylase [Vibrio]NAW96435.1 putative pyridoxal-dependent aspartate 1-decarboxylase [Vibrio sp. V42_P2S4T144]ANP64459.1 glutamate decarboxylase [Vibrio alginolyticus]EGQ8445656.1 putative pyridoxal-dependent aspartate 1-decarboxylase [Vibrio alginolyticus]EGQ9095306.1 putative pyridoxal-dependent aspartate 1-decarboxylase [Vibrio alginolyticus]EGQ9109037.1 putative pyridoxal-dependent aspartate 1-decarboxylase [Vibrio alginolyticus]
MVKEQKTADVSFESLLKIFTVPEGPDSTLTKIDESLSRNLNQFLREHIVAEEKPLREIEKDFSSAQIPEQPEFVSDHTEHLLDTLVSHSVHTSSPSFIGHMTSALPYFLMPLSKIMIALNQNLVKIETSKAFTPLERQVLGMLHRLIYGQNDTFYNQWMHSANHSLGAFCSGGTIANITALWVARNKALRANGSFKGVEKEGLFKAMKHYGYDGLAVLVSERGHYSLKKAADVLGLGQEGLVAVKTDANNRIIVNDLKAKIVELEKQNIKPIAVIGVAGTTETGNVDPLPEIAEVCQAHSCHFHVDAAWGGATLMSNHHRHLLKGVEMADSVTIDAHKQLYIPMGAGMVLFKDPDAMKSIEHHAQYILRKGSKDLGSHTLEGSRSGMAMLVYAAMHIISRPGYELLIDQSIEKARYFADLIKQQDDFELVSEPELCLLTYRYLPPFIREALAQAEGSQKEQLNELINELTQFIQKRQRETGKSFVSRTRLNPDQWQRMNTIVFRVVLANPLTTKEILSSVLDEQREIAKQAPNLMKRIQQLVVDIQSS